MQKKPILLNSETVVELINCEIKLYTISTTPDLSVGERKAVRDALSLVKQKIESDVEVLARHFLGIK